MKYLCEEQSLAFDLPVMKGGVTYKNVFCFICNKNFDIENDFLGEQYKVMEFNVICKKPFHFTYKINLHDILQGAVEEGCGVILNAKKAVLCEEYPPNTISTCKNKATQPSLRWACEKSSKHSLPPVHQYKNEFCQLCRQMEHFHPNDTIAEREMYPECDKSNEIHVQYERACLSLPNVAYHPYVTPHRNIFCSYCAGNDHYRQHIPSNSCEPTFGNNVHFVDRLVRNLFFPSMTFDSKISIRSEEVG
jgi:hypothetical protein